MYQVVNVKTQEEWDFVSKCLGYEFKIMTFMSHKNDSCINLFGLHSGNIDYFRERNSTIYSFNEWCELTNNYPENIRNDIVIDQDLSYLSEFLTKLEIT